jgi:23S rRNA pseudouridine1911/1915/1917 synthase
MKKDITYEEPAHARLDVFLRSFFPEHSRSAIQNLIEKGFVRINGNKITAPAKKLFKGDKIEIVFPEIISSQKPLVPARLKLDIIYEDDYIYLINKPPGIVVHPGAGREQNTIVNAILAVDENFPKKFNDELRPGIVHRLDKDSSGCLLVAKNIEAQKNLIKSFADRKVEKTYLAVTNGIPVKKEGTIDSFYGRHPGDRKKMAVLKKSSRRAVTKYKVLKEGQINGCHCALVELSIETGRTHQIRVHMAHIKTPVLGDKIYGGKQKKAPETLRQILHAWKLSFPHPHTGEKLSFESPLPPYFERIISMIR